MGCVSATSVKHDGCHFDKVSLFPDACFHGAKEKIEKTHPIEDKKIQLEDRLINRYSAGFWELPINLSVQSGARDAVEYLIRNGVIFDKKNEDHQNVFHIAAIHGRTDILEMIFISIARSEDGNNNRAKKRGIDAVDVYFGTPLLYAITNGNLKIVQLFLKENANPKARIVESTVRQGDETVTKMRMINPLETAMFWKENERQRDKERLNHDARYRKRKEYGAIVELLQSILMTEDVKPRKQAGTLVGFKGNPSGIQVNLLSSSTSDSDNGKHRSSKVAGAPQLKAARSSVISNTPSLTLPQTLNLNQTLPTTTTSTNGVIDNESGFKSSTLLSSLSKVLPINRLFASKTDIICEGSDEIGSSKSSSLIADKIKNLTI